jgi:hypothetical protein
MRRYTATAVDQRSTDSLPVNRFIFSTDLSFLNMWNSQLPVNYTVLGNSLAQKLVSPPRMIYTSPSPHLPTPISCWPCPWFPHNQWNFLLPPPRPHTQRKYGSPSGSCLLPYTSGLGEGGGEVTLFCIDTSLNSNCPLWQVIVKGHESEFWGLC